MFTQAGRLCGGFLNQGDLLIGGGEDAVTVLSLQIDSHWRLGCLGLLGCLGTRRGVSLTEWHESQEDR